MSTLMLAWFFQTNIWFCVTFRLWVKTYQVLYPFRMIAPFGSISKAFWIFTVHYGPCVLTYHLKYLRKGVWPVPYCPQEDNDLRREKAIVLAPKNEAPTVAPNRPLQATWPRQVKRSRADARGGGWCDPWEDHRGKRAPRARADEPVAGSGRFGDSFLKRCGESMGQFQEHLGTRWYAWVLIVRCFQAFQGVLFRLR